MSNMIKQVRKNKGITQKQLAEALDITPQAVSQFEKSNSDRFTVSTLQNIANALDCQVDDLIASDDTAGMKEHAYSFETDKESSTVSRLSVELKALNLIGIDTLQKYIELLLSSEKYTSKDLSYLKEVWGEETVDLYYSGDGPAIDNGID